MAWSADIRSHPSSLLLNSISERLPDAQTRATQDTPERLDYWKRANEVIEHLRGRLEKAPASLIPRLALDTVEGLLRKILNEIESFISDGNPSRIDDINTELDRVLMEIPF